MVDGSREGRHSLPSRTEEPEQHTPQPAEWGNFRSPGRGTPLLWKGWVPGGDKRVLVKSGGPRAVSLLSYREHGWVRVFLGHLQLVQKVRGEAGAGVWGEVSSGPFLWPPPAPSAAPPTCALGSGRASAAPRSHLPALAVTRRLGVELVWARASGLGSEQE